MGRPALQDERPLRRDLQDLLRILGRAEQSSETWPDDVKRELVSRLSWCVRRYTERTTQAALEAEDPPRARAR